VVLGILLIAFGLAFLVLQQLEVDFGQYGWPLFVIVPGIALIAYGLYLAEGSGAVVGGTVTTMVGLVLLYQNSTDHWESWAYAWALAAPAGVGLGLILYGIVRDQPSVVSGGLWPLGIGLAIFGVGFVFFEQATQSDPGGPHLLKMDIPLLSDIPWGLGRAFENLSPVFLFAALLVFPESFALYRTRWGLRLRSAGENPEATRSLGVGVAPLQWQGVLLSGALAGLSGAFLSVEVVGNWREGQTLGLGFIALAALILSNWNPVRLIFATFLFGFAQAIPLRFRSAPVIEAIPEQLISTIPYVVTIIAVAGFVGRGGGGGGRGGGGAGRGARGARAPGAGGGGGENP
jgi:ABC-type uncharacterized transport system permease subunit